MKSSTYDQSNHWGLTGVYGLHKRYIFVLGQQVGKHIFPSSVHNPLLQSQTPNIHKLKSIRSLFLFISNYFDKNKWSGRNIKINRCLFGNFLILKSLQNKMSWNEKLISTNQWYNKGQIEFGKHSRTDTATVAGSNSGQAPVTRLAAVALEAANSRSTYTLPVFVTAIRHWSQPIATASRTRNWATLLVRSRRCGQTVQTTTVRAVWTVYYLLILELFRVVWNKRE